MKTVIFAACLLVVLGATSACSSVDDGKEKKGLTKEQIAKMSPEELERYYESQQKKEAARDFSRSFQFKTESRSQRKAVLHDTSHQLTDEEQGSVFPWRSEPGRRSESLHGRTNFEFE